MYVFNFINPYSRVDGFIDEMQYNIITGSQKIVYTKWIRQFRYGSNGFHRFRPPSSTQCVLTTYIHRRLGYAAHLRSFPRD